MKKHVKLLAITLCFIFPCIAQNKISIEEAADRIGDTVSICGKIMNATILEHLDDKPTHLVLGNNKVEAQVIIIIPDGSRKRFDYKPEKDLLNRQVCITGKLEEIEGKMHMTIHRQDDINIIKD